MDNQEHQLNYKLKTQLLNKIHFPSTKSMLKGLKEIAEKTFLNKSKNNLKPWSNHPELAELYRKQKDTWLKMKTKIKNNIEYEKLKQLRKQQIKQLKCKAKIHYDKWLDRQLLKIERCSDNMKICQAVKFLKMKNSCKVTSQIEDIENHFKKKFSPDVSAIHLIQLTLPKTFDKIINIEEFQNAIKKT